MKRLILMVILTAGTTLAQHATLTGRSTGVLIMSNDNDPLPLAFAKEKSCGGLHEVQYFGKSNDLSDWSLAVVKDGRGVFEITLFAVAEEPHHYVFLGTNTKKAVHKACDIINGREKPVWMAVQ
jgi:hypothetical protein